MAVRCSSTQSLRSVLPADVAATLAFGTSPDGTAIGPDDFATTGTVSFTIDVPAGGNVVEFQADAELGKDRNAVVRLMISDRPEGTSRDALQRVLLGDPQSAGYKAFRAGMAEYVVAPAAELARRSESRGQGSGAGAVRQHLQQPRARRVRAEGEVPAQRQVLHRQHGGRRRSRAARTRRGTICSDRGRTTTPTSACWSITTASSSKSRRIAGSRRRARSRRCLRRRGRTHVAARALRRGDAGRRRSPSPATSTMRWPSRAARGAGR